MLGKATEKVGCLAGLLFRGARGSGGIISCSFARGRREEPESWEDVERRDSLSEADMDKWSICRITSRAPLPIACTACVVSS